MRSSIALVLLLFMGAVPRPLFAGPLLSQFLTELEDKVRSLIDHAGATANTVIIRAGSEVDAEINNFRAAYADMLNKTIESLDKEATKLLDQVKSDVSALENKTAQDAERIAKLAVEGAILLPLSNKIPQVTFVNPSFELAPGEGVGDQFMLQLTGVFTQAATPGYQPSVSFPNQPPIAPVSLTTQKLVFMIPRSVLKPSGKATSFVQIPITVPYKSGVFSGKKNAEFKASIVGLPPLVGNMTLSHRVSGEVPRSAQVVSIQDNMQSDRDDHEEVRCGPNEAHTIDASTVRVVFDRTEGSTWTYHPVRINNPSVCFWFRTEHHRFGTSDKIWWHYEYTTRWTESSDHWEGQPLKMKWGDSYTFPYSAGQFQLTFDAFDGSHDEFQASRHDNRYIDVSAEGSGIRIAARPVEGILPPAGAPSLLDFFTVKVLVQ